VGKIKLTVFGASGRMGREVTDLARIDKQLQIVGLDARPHVVIDFSSPEGVLKIAKWCAENKVPLVSGTTGLTSGQLKRIKSLTGKIPTLLSPNFSLGLNAMAKAVEVFLSSTTPVEVVIKEVHHKNKKDNPSGTAKFLQSVIKQSVTKSTKLSEPVGKRIGDVFGVHTVSCFLDGELITFEHEARDRKIFAQGAIEVAKWLYNQRPGVYTMKDYIEGISQ